MTEADITTQTFRLTLGDHVRFWLTTYFRNFVSWPGVAINGAALVAFPVLVNLAELQYGRFEGFLSILTVMACVLLVFVPLMSLISVWLNYKRNPMSHGSRSVRVTQQSFILEGKEISADLAWSNFKKVEQTRTQFQLYLNANVAHLVPKIRLRRC